MRVLWVPAPVTFLPTSPCRTGRSGSECHRANNRADRGTAAVFTSPIPLATARVRWSHFCSEPRQKEGLMADYQRKPNDTGT